MLKGKEKKEKKVEKPMKKKGKDMKEVNPLLAKRSVNGIKTLRGTRK